MREHSEAILRFFVKFMLALILLLFFGGKLYWSYYWSVREDGFKRGVLWEAVYQKCTGKFLSVAAQNNLAHLANNPLEFSCPSVVQIAEGEKVKQ